MAKQPRVRRDTNLPNDDPFMTQTTPPPANTAAAAKSPPKESGPPEGETDAAPKTGVAETFEPPPEFPRPVGLLAGHEDTITLDPRKLTSSQAKAVAKDWTGDRRGKMLDNYLTGLVDKARTKFGASNVLVGNDTQNLLVGIPTPALAFEYLIAQNVFPCSQLLHLHGPPGSNKSSLLFEFMRWTLMAGGLANYIEVESKMSPDLMPSIVGYDNTQRVIVDFADSVEGWQARVNFWVDQYRQMFGKKDKDDPGPGRTVPILIGVDSIVGKLSAESQETLLDAGHGGRAFPVEAMQITQFVKTIPGLLANWPITLVFNNHMKVGKDDNGHEVHRTGGGCGVNFQEAFELETSIRKQSIKSAHWNGRIIGIRCRKSSFGDTYRSIEARILWTEVLQPDGTWRQHTTWDWDWATVKMLSTLEGAIAGRVKDVLHIDTPKVSDVENTAWSKTLGMKASDACSWSKLGAMIAADASLVRSLRGALGIKNRKVLSGDYLTQLSNASAALP